MLLLSVLLTALGCVQLSQSRRLPERDIDNDVSTNPEGNLLMEGGFDSSFREFVRITQPPVQRITRNVGQHVELQCEAMGSPPPTIQWYKRNMRITENEPFDQSTIIDNSQGVARVSSRLVIHYILPRHQDVYRCMAESGGRSAGAITELIVPDRKGNEMNFTQLVAHKILGAHHMPRVTFWAPAYMEFIGSNVVLPCKSVGNPKPTLTWTDPNGNVINGNDRFTVLPDGELRIKSITWDDMGVYNCIVVNSMGEDMIETFLYPMKESSED